MAKIATTAAAMLGLVLAIFDHAAANDLLIVDRPYLAVGDVLALDVPSDAAGRVIYQPLMSLEEGVVTPLDSDLIEARLERRVPGLKNRLVRRSNENFSVVYRETLTQKTAETCVVLSQALTVGFALRKHHAMLSDVCDEPESAVFRYDASIESYRAERDLAAGTVLPIRTISVLPEYISGDELTLVSRTGNVEVVRPVTLLQSSDHGQRVQVRTSSGDILLADLAPEIISGMELR